MVIVYFKENKLLKNNSNFKFPVFINKKIETPSATQITLPNETMSVSPNKIEERKIQEIVNKDPSSPTSLDYNRAFGELINLGCKPTLDGSKQAIRVSKSLDGRWFYCRKSGFNTQKDRIYLTLNRMPYLQTLLLKIELSDPLLKIQGGRVLITFDGHYRKNIYSHQLDSILIN
jgi:hypothetical protein